LASFAGSFEPCQQAVVVSVDYVWEATQSGPPVSHDRHFVGRSRHTKLGGNNGDNIWGRCFPFRHQMSITDDGLMDFRSLFEAEVPFAVLT